MRHRILTPALLVPLLTLANPAPASAQFDFGSWFQRATIIANQITQISHQVSQIRSMARQLTELEGQLDHMERAARGEIDALLQPFSDLAADPVGLVRDGLGWRSDFTGQARGTVDAVRRFGNGRSFTNLWRTAHGTADRGDGGRRTRALPEPPAAGRDPGRSQTTAAPGRRPTGSGYSTTRRSTRRPRSRGPSRARRARSQTSPRTGTCPTRLSSRHGSPPR